MATTTPTLGDDMLRGAEQISEFLFGSPNQRAKIYHLARTGVIPCFNLGATICAVAADLPIPLVTLGPPCGVRAVAIRHLDATNRPWREAFVGGSCGALVAAVRAGLGIAPIGAVASGRMGDVGAHFGLPELPPSEIVMFARTGSPAASAAARALEGAVRTMLRGQ